MNEHEHESSEPEEPEELIGDETAQPTEGDEASAEEIRARLANVDTQAELPDA